MTRAKKAAAGKVDLDTLEKIDLAAEEFGITRSRLVARILEKYVQENPDDIPALRPDDPLSSMAAFTEDLVR